MRRRVQRIVLLAGAAVLAGVIALALARGRSGERTRLPAPALTWYTAVAGVRSPAAFGTRTACGSEIGPTTEGVGHPVLPCGTRLYLAVGGEAVLTEVIDRVPNAAPFQFDLTAALAERLGLRDRAEIRWTYARSS